MPYTPSPLRYPGGKTQLYNFAYQILQSNNMLGSTYAEPFAGGAGLAVKLLLNDAVKHIIINDLDISIYAFWYSILNHTAEFCELILGTDISVDEWKIQREKYEDRDTNNLLELGFSTFYLNRTNVSGVIKGGIIGGIDQTGNYKLDARFNKENLIQRIALIAQKKEQISISNLDAKNFLDSPIMKSRRNVFINFDPPYVKKGSQLYKNSFTEWDHIALSKKIKGCQRKWMLTYDICPLIRDLYRKYRGGTLDINYSIGDTKNAKEYVFFSNNIAIPSEYSNKIEALGIEAR